MAAARYLGALAIVALGAVHLQQYVGADYSAIPTIGTLFLLNAIASGLVGSGLLAPLHRMLADRRADVAVALLAAAAVAIAVGSLVALLVSEDGTLFGFSEVGSYRTVIVVAIATEVLTVILLGPVAVTRVVRARSHRVAPRVRHPDSGARAERQDVARLHASRRSTRRRSRQPRSSSDCWGSRQVRSRPPWGPHRSESSSATVGVGVVASAVVNPLSLTTIPADVLAALRTLPALSRRLDAIAESTEALPPIRSAIEGVAQDTKALPALQRDIARVALATEPLPAMREATDVLPAMHERMGAIEAAMPTLVEVQQQLARLPDTMDRLAGGLTELSTLLDRLLGSLDHLDDNVSSLHAAVAPLGRIADRLPGSGRS